jgi:hypothetical protein
VIEPNLAGATAIAEHWHELVAERSTGNPLALASTSVRLARTQRQAVTATNVNTNFLTSC